jgi:DNA-binding PadR family transcriptional regulator
MRASNDNDFEGTLDFFLLSGLSDGPRSLSEIEQRIKWAQRLLYLAAKRKGKRPPDSLPGALERLQSEGFLNIERLVERPDTGIIYSLTEVGKHRVEQERTRRRLMVSQFVEDSELDGSFQKFLDRQGPVWPS